MKKVAVFASGSGTNFQSIIDAAKEENGNYEVVLLVCDKRGAKVIERANQAGIPTFNFSAKDYINKAAFEREILQKLIDFNVDFIALAGYMRLIGQVLLEAFQDRIVNIHPSLLPSFPGKDAIGQAIDAKVEKTGVTVHYVDAGMDTGTIISQEALNILPSDTYESLQRRVQEIEHRLYPNTLAQILGEGSAKK